MHLPALSSVSYISFLMICRSPRSPEGADSSPPEIDHTALCLVQAFRANLATQDVRVSGRSICDLAANLIARRNGRTPCILPSRNPQTIKNYSSSVGSVKCIEMNAGDIVIQ